MAQDQPLINYEAILKSHKKKHSRGVGVFQRLYGFDDHDAFFLLVRREWKRWYAYKRCVKALELHLVGTEAWVVRNLCDSSMNNLRKICKKVVKDLHYVQEGP